MHRKVLLDWFGGEWPFEFSRPWWKRAERWLQRRPSVFWELGWVVKVMDWLDEVGVLK